MSPVKAHFFCIWNLVSETVVEDQELIISLANQVLQDQDMFLVDTELKGTPENRIVWIFVEAEKGNVSLDRCAELSRELQLLLDVHGWHERKYTLNVSSPGLDRPLKDIRQYVNNVGRNAHVIFEKDGKQIRAEGTLADATPELIILVTGDRQQLEIPFTDIVEARIVPSFK